MAYKKHTWKKRLGSGLNKFKDTITGKIMALVNEPDEVTQEGTPLREDWLNEMEDGIYRAHVTADAALPASGGVLTGGVKFDNGTLFGLNDPKNPDHVANKRYVDNNFLSLKGGVLTGGVKFDNGTLFGVNDPKNPDHVANKRYVDTTAQKYLPKSGGTMSGSINMNSKKITNLTSPTESGDAASKNYVDEKIAPLNECKQAFAYRTIKNCNDFQWGMARVDGSTTNKPPEVTSGIIFANNAVQNCEGWIRFYSSGSWGSWTYSNSRIQGGTGAPPSSLPPGSIYVQY